MELLNMLPDWLGILLIALIIGLGNTLSYLFLSDVKKLKHLRKEVRKAAEEYKKTKSEKAIEKLDKIQSEYLKLTFRPMMAGMVIALLFLPILIGTYGDVRGKGSVILLGRNVTIEERDGRIYVDGKPTDGIFKMFGKTWEVRKKGDEFVVSRVVILLPFSLPLIGRTVGWILFYVLVSLPLVTLLRKALGIEL